MAKQTTIAFAVSVTVDDKIFAPGDPIKIGKTKGSISEEDAANVEKVHGLFVGTSSPVADADTSKLEADLGTATTRAETAEDNILDLEKQVADASARAETAEDKTVDLDEQVSAGVVLVKELEARVSELEAEIAELTKPGKGG